MHDMLFDTTVTLCIILNTAFLAVEHHGMSEDLKYVLDIGNKVLQFPLNDKKYICNINYIYIYILLYIILSMPVLFYLFLSGLYNILYC